MKNIFKALDLPLYVTIGLIITSLVGKRNIIAEELPLYLICVFVLWGMNLVRYILKDKKKKKESE